MTDRNEPLRLMDEREQKAFTNDGFDGVVILKDFEWRALRAALEAQRDELAQKDTRIARLEGAISEWIERRGYSQFTHVSDETNRILVEVFDEHPRQSAAAIKAEALRGWADGNPLYAGSDWEDGWNAALEDAKREAGRIEADNG